MVRTNVPKDPLKPGILVKREHSLKPNEEDPFTSTESDTTSGNLFNVAKSDVPQTSQYVFGSTNKTPKPSPSFTFSSQFQTQISEEKPVSPVKPVPVGGNSVSKHNEGPIGRKNAPTHQCTNQCPKTTSDIVTTIEKTSSANKQNGRNLRPADGTSASTNGSILDLPVDLPSRKSKAVPTLDIKLHVQTSTPPKKQEHFGYAYVTPSPTRYKTHLPAQRQFGLNTPPETPEEIFMPLSVPSRGRNYSIPKLAPSSPPTPVLRKSFPVSPLQELPSEVETDQTHILAQCAVSRLDLDVCNSVCSSDLSNVEHVRVGCSSRLRKLKESLVRRFISLRRI